jgi:hypothetical protein
MWVGFQIERGREEFAVAPEKIKAISNFPQPANKTELCLFMGLVEQMVGFSSKVATTKASLRPLLSSRNV